MAREASQRGRLSVLPLIVTGLVVTLVTACANRPAAPIEDRDRGGIARPEQRYTVLRGDTLYAIAFRYGLDYRRLAAANHIPAPYRIFPGQALVLAEAEVARSSPGTSPVGAAPAPSAREAGSTTRAASGARPAPAARAGAAATDARDAPARQAQPAPTPPPVREAPSTVRPPLSAAGELPDSAVDAWRWPASGRVARGFDGNLHKGIDIAGDRGDPVLAAASGRVVYAGSGIAGYGLMLILRHNDEFLSAYGHNEALLVEEGDVVRAGQTIARRGSTGTDSVKLHFEIRRRGRPVDPRGLLPRR